MDKNAAMARLVSESGGVGKSSRECGSKLVWGEGELDCRLFIVGEAPGREEERAGRPCVELRRQATGRRACLGWDRSPGRVPHQCREAPSDPRARGQAFEPPSHRAGGEDVATDAAAGDRDSETLGGALSWRGRCLGGHSFGLCDEPRAREMVRWPVRLASHRDISSGVSTPKPGGAGIVSGGLRRD